MAVQISGNDITVPRDGSFTRNVTIGGTLTYEDVTNIDSVGLVTARTGIEIGARPGVAASISVDGNMIISGISTFGGDIQVPDKIVHTGDTDTAIRFPSGNAVSIETAGSERLRIDSTGNMGLGVANPNVLNEAAKFQELTLGGKTEGAAITLKDADGNVQGGMFTSDATGAMMIRTITSHPMIFRTNNTDRLRIDTSGRLLIGTTTEGADSGDDLTISNSGNMGLTLRSTDSNYCNIYFSDATSGTAEYAGYVSYQHSTDSLQFATASTERLRIDSSGRLGLGTNNPDTLLHLKGGSGSSTLQRFQSDSYSSYIAQIQANDNVSNGSIAGDLALRGQSGISMSANNGTASHFRIASDGNVIIGTSTWSYAKPLNVQGSSGSILSLYNADTTSYAADTNSSIEFKLLTGNTGNTSGSCELRAFKANGTNGNNARGLSFWTGGNGGSNAERYRIHSDGTHSWNNTTFPYNEHHHFYAGTSGKPGMSIFYGTDSDESALIMRHGRAGANSGAWTGKFIQFRSSDGNERGSVTGGSSSVAYNTSSDYRLKENEVTISDAISKVKQLKPYTFNFKVTPDQKVDGFFAHEAQEVVSYTVTGEKDAEDMQQMDYGKLTPLLTAALKESITEIESLKARLDAAGL